MFNMKDVSRETKDGYSGILWFIFLTPVAMLMYYLAHEQVEITYTIMGWLVASLAGIQLGIGLARGGLRLFRVPISIFPKLRKTNA